MHRPERHRSADGSLDIVGVIPNAHETRSRSTRRHRRSVSSTGAWERRNSNTTDHGDDTGGRGGSAGTKNGGGSGSGDEKTDRLKEEGEDEAARGKHSLGLDAVDATTAGHGDKNQEKDAGTAGDTPEAHEQGDAKDKTEKGKKHVRRRSLFGMVNMSKGVHVPFRRKDPD